MEVDRGLLRGPSSRTELALVLLLAWFAFAGLVLYRGELGISWDALNHQIYLGWTAERSRFDLDVMPASYQTYQYPYLYWPLYELAVHGFSGWQAGVVLATLQLASVPPLWIVARSCIGEESWFGTAMRILAVGLAFTSPLVISLFHSTSNDMLAGAPFLWAVALVFGDVRDRRVKDGAQRRVILSGFLAGVSVAAKFSNGPLALLFPVLWMLMPGSAATRLRRTALGCVAVLTGCLLAYAPWGWKLWVLHGNPVFPYADGWFAHVRAAAGWAP